MEMFRYNFVFIFYSEVLFVWMMLINVVLEGFNLILLEYFLKFKLVGFRFGKIRG